MVIVSIGIDLAKNVFAVHSADPIKSFLVRPNVPRAKLLELIASLSCCIKQIIFCLHNTASKVRRSGRADFFGATGYSRLHAICRIHDCRCSTLRSPIGQSLAIERQPICVKLGLTWGQVLSFWRRSRGR